MKLGGLDAIYHDGLSRCRDTAMLLHPNVLVEDEGPGPWNMGNLFEGRPITEDSLRMARWYIQGNQYGQPPGGETFAKWQDRWLRFMLSLTFGWAAVGVVTHNRNIQYLYSLHEGEFIYKFYDVDGPGFCSVHYFDQRTGLIAPWGGKWVPRGIYLIRHGETSWGT